MKIFARLAIAAATFTLAAQPVTASAALAVGAQAPDFTTRGALAGKVLEKVHLAELLKKGPVVLYFFPAAFTPGCSAEAREFAENIAAFKKAGASVLGMSADPVDKLVDFSAKDCANKFAVASAGPAVITGYDVALPQKAGLTNRTSYVIAPTGRIVFVHSDLNYVAHVKSTLEFVQGMHKGH